MKPENPPATTPKKQSWFERHPKKTLFFLLSVIFLGLTFATEKILSYRGQSRPMEMTRFVRLREYEPGYFGYVYPNDDYIQKTDSLVQQRYLLRVDDNGFTMPSRVHEKPDFNLFFLGGSTTACDHVTENKRFPYLVGRNLEKACGLKVNSTNAGRGGNDSLHSLNILLNKIIPLKPDMVVFLHNINDLTILLYEGTYWDKHPERSPIVTLKPSLFDGRRLLYLTIPHLYDETKNLEKIFRKKVLARFRAASPEDEFHHVRGRQVRFDRAVLIRQFSRNMQTFIDLCRIHDIIPVLMTMENRLKAEPDPVIREYVQGLEDQGVPYAVYKGLFDDFNQVIRHLGEQNRVKVIDLALLVPPEKTYMYDVVHFNDYGSEFAARLISRELQPLIGPCRDRKATSGG